MRFFTPIIFILLVGCSSDASYYRAADNKILCELSTKRAFIVTPTLGNASLVKRATSYDELCQALQR